MVLGPLPPSPCRHQALCNYRHACLAHTVSMLTLLVGGMLSKTGTSQARLLSACSRSSVCRCITAQTFLISLWSARSGLSFVRVSRTLTASANR
jgi:hypothetical protein